VPYTISLNTVFNSLRSVDQNDCQITSPWWRNK